MASEMSLEKSRTDSIGDWRVICNGEGLWGDTRLHSIA